MESDHSATGWSYLLPRAGRPGLFIRWSICCSAEGPGRALLWLDGAAEPEIVEVAGPCHLMAGILAKAQARQVSDGTG